MSAVPGSDFFESLKSRTCTSLVVVVEVIVGKDIAIGKNLFIDDSLIGARAVEHSALFEGAGGVARPHFIFCGIVALAAITCCDGACVSDQCRG